MKTAMVVFLGSALLLVSPAVAMQEKKQGDDATSAKKKAHDEITKWVKAKDRQVKDEIKLYDQLVGANYKSKDALDVVKKCTDSDLDAGKLLSFLKKKVEAKVKGKELEDAVNKEMASMIAAKKKEGPKGKEGSTRPEKGK